MDAWDSFLEKSIEDCKRAKKRSRENEIHLLENSDRVSGNLVQRILSQEREYREYLDGEIDDYRSWLMERKEVKNEQT